MRNNLLLLVFLLFAAACSDDAVQPQISVNTGGGTDGDSQIGGTDASSLDADVREDGLLIPDGIFIEDGKIIIPDGVILPDGVFISDGTIIGPDGVVIDIQPADVPAIDVPKPDCPGGYQCVCKKDDECDSQLCIDADKPPPNPATFKCAKLCTPGQTDCGKGWSCQVYNGFPNQAFYCLPEIPCSPAPETCNGIDDDCNGATDEGVLCNDAQPCTTDSCGGISGCQHDNAPFATACDLDGTACTSDHCLGGQCVVGGKTDCGDGDPCTSDSCDATNGDCVHTPNGMAPCDDGNPCTEGDICSPKAIGCISGVLKVCNDANPCTIDNCDASTGKCTFSPFQNGVSCDDGSKCTFSDKCQNGVCTGKPLSCEDGQVCTDDTCDASQGCQHPPIDGIQCDDGLPCTTGDLCSGGLCKSSGILGCDDGNPCTTDACAVGGGCSHNPSTGGCNDGTFCTTGDSCATGACVGQVVSCDDNSACTTDSCDPKIGCVFADNNVPCNDGNACTTGDACTGGTCAPGVGVNCDDGVSCTKDLCDSSTGGCSHSPDVKLCDDGIVCTADACVTATGCTHTDIPQCCGGKQCASDETCITYPDNLVPFCAKSCNSGSDCPGSCCYMTYKQKHCLVDPYLAECCGTTEYWATDSDPYKCGVGGKGECLEWPNKTKPYWPSKITGCVNICTSNQDCPGTCCNQDTMGNQNCVLKGYENMYCPNGP